MTTEHQNWNGPKLRHRRLAPWATPLAICGVLLPYAVAFLPNILFRQEIQSHDFYYAGKAATLDTVTGWLTGAAIVLGALLCWPWVRDRYVATESRILWIFGIAGFAIVHFVAVFVARFLFYVGSGGTFP